jgi:hypothetical protein
MNMQILGNYWEVKDAETEAPETETETETQHEDRDAFEYAMETQRVWAENE